MGLATGLLAYATGRALYDVRTGFWAAMLAVFGTGSVFSARIISTDLPLVLFWALALLAYVRLLQKADWRWAVVLGVAIGAGLLAKYAMIYFLPGMLLAAVFEKQARALLVRPELWLALGLAVLTVSPNILWNIANGFLTLRHAGGNVIGEPIDPSVKRPLEFLAAQFAVFGPVVFGVAIAAAIAPLILPSARIGSNRLLPADRILLAFALPPLVVVIRDGHAWCMPMRTGPPLPSSRLPCWRRRSWCAGISRSCCGAASRLGLAAQILLIGADAFATRIRLPFLSTPNPYYRTLGWNAYGRTVGQLARKLGISTIASDTRADVASLLYYWRDQPEQILAWPTADLPNFELTRGLTTAAPQPVLFVSQCPVADRLETVLRQGHAARHFRSRRSGAARVRGLQARRTARPDRTVGAVSAWVNRGGRGFP